MIPTIAAHAPDECITACHDIGRRHFPEEVPESNVSVAERPESFEMRSTQDMYKEFPGLIRSSYPLYIRNAGPQVCACCPKSQHSVLPKVQPFMSLGRQILQPLAATHNKEHAVRHCNVRFALED